MSDAPDDRDPAEFPDVDENGDERETTGLDEHGDPSAVTDTLPRTCQELVEFALRRAFEGWRSRLSAMYPAPNPVDQGWLGSMFELGDESIGLCFIDRRIRTQP